MRSRLLAIALLIAAGCGRTEGRLRDDAGRDVTLARPVRRVVTLAPNITEIVYAAGGGSRVVGTDDSSDHPPAAVKLPKVGGVSPSIEKIVSLEPDLVLASSSTNHGGLARALGSAGIPLFVLRTDRLADIPRALDLTAGLLGERGTDASSSLRDGIEAQRRVRQQHPRILFLVWTSPLYVAGKETFIDELIALTGGTNAVGVRGWPQYSLEALLASPPDLILFPDRSLSEARLREFFAADGRWAQLEAVREGRLSGVDEDVFTRPGPRVALAAAALNAIIDRWEREPR